METISRNIETLTAFHAVAVSGSFTRAAESLGTSKAMVSKQVKRLETYMKSQLFHRTTRTLKLTEEGTALLVYSQKIFALSDEASKRLRDMSQGTTGQIRISAPVSLGEAIFPTLLPKMASALPQVKFEIELSNENKDLIQDQVDFALRATEVEHPDLIAKYLGRIRDVVCASPSFLKKHKVASDPRKLRDLPCLMHSLDTSWNVWNFASGKEELQVEVCGNVATNQYPMARLLCQAGMGIARIPLYLVADDIKYGVLVPLFESYEIATHPLYLVYLRNEYASRKHKIVKELILDWFKENSFILCPIL